MTARPFIRAEEVAALTGYATAAAFRLARQRLEEDLAFPLPMPTCRNPMIWRRDAVEAWVASQGLPRTMPVPMRPEGPNVILLEEARRA
jgi:predicted DNA-binding transcriptional regulator AlpA